MKTLLKNSLTFLLMLMPVLPLLYEEHCYE